MLVLVTVTGIAAFQSQNREAPRKKAQYPVVDYNAPEPADPQERAKRRKKGEKYDNALMPINPSAEEVFQNEVEHFLPGTPALPVSQSAAVIIGTVTKSQAHLTPDKSYVYSEFDVLVDEVVKNDTQSPITTGKAVPVERPGGRVLMPSGRIHEYRTTLEPLEVGGRYALFLIRRGDDYQVFAGYKIEGGKIFPVDDYFKLYEGASEEDFMRDLRQATTPHEVMGLGYSPTATAPETVTVGDEPTDSESDPGGDCQLPAPPACVQPPNDQRPRFAPGTVTVTYNPDHFSPEQVQAIRNGYMVWNGLGGVNFTEPSPNKNRPAPGAANTLHFEG